MRILAFDTSDAHCAAALIEGDDVVATVEESMARGQAERLMPLLAELMAATGTRWTDLRAIGVGIGPGNFTGVRISVAAARGLALALKIPAIGVGTLEARAEGVEPPFTVVEDARRGEAYVQHFTQNGGGGAPHLVPAARITGQRRIGALGPVPQGVEMLRPVWPLAVAMARIAARRLAEHPAGLPWPRPAPMYLRAADAAPPADPPPVLIDG